MQIFPIVIKECPEYSLNIPANREEQAIRVAKALYAGYGKKHFVQNGKKVKYPIQKSSGT